MDRAAIALDTDEQKKWQGTVDLLIPMAKAHPTEKGVELSSLALQVFGGAGYSSEYPIEQFMRDSKVACIFEGTTGIQAIDFALRKVPMRGGSVFRGFLDNMDEVLDQASALSDWGPFADQLRKTRDGLAALPGILANGEEKSRLRDQLLAATPFMEAASDTIVAYFLLWSAMVAENKIAEKGGLPEDSKVLLDTLERDPELAHLAGKIDSARYFIASVLPMVDGKIAGLAWMDSSACTIAEVSL
jgi:hypothetical protein